MGKKTKRTALKAGKKTVIAEGPGTASKSRIVIIAAAVIAAIMLIAIPLHLKGKKAQEQKAEQLMATAGTYVNMPVAAGGSAAPGTFFSSEAEKYGKIQSVYLSVLKEYGKTRAYPEALIGLADAYCENNQVFEAWDRYNQFIKELPDSKLIVKAYIGKGKVVFKQGKYNLAAGEWEDVLRKYKAGYDKFALQLQLAEAYLKLDNKAAAKTLCEGIAKEADDANIVNSARELLKGIK